MIVHLQISIMGFSLVHYGSCGAPIFIILINALHTHVGCKMAAKLLIIGAGATGSLTACLLTRSIPDLSIAVWEKARGTGGRMTTYRSLDSTDHVDLGAQYITRYKTPFMEELKTQLFQELIDYKVLIAFNGTIEDEPPVNEDVKCGNFVCPTGLNSVPKYFLDNSNAKVHLSHDLKTININTKQQIIECGWISEGNDEKWAEFKSLILTLPIPQILTLKGNLVKHIDQSDFSNLKQVQYSSRYALGMFFNERIPKYLWTAKYFKHPVIRYICWDNLKYGNALSNGALLIHTSVPFGIEHLEDEMETVIDLILLAINEILPGIPTPSHTKLIRWKYSQVYKPYPGTPGCVVLHKNPLVVATGDAFTHSNLEGCIEAAYHTSKTMKQFL